jgi:hypothetical protein
MKEEKKLGREKGKKKCGKARNKQKVQKWGSIPYYVDVCCTHACWLQQILPSDNRAHGTETSKPEEGRKKKKEAVKVKPMPFLGLERRIKNA